MASKAKNPTRRVTLDLCPQADSTESITLKINLDKYLVSMLKNINRGKPTKNKDWYCVAAVLFTEAMREAMLEYATNSFKGNSESKSNLVH
jgi:hypothetical protein